MVVATVYAEGEAVRVVRGAVGEGTREKMSLATGSASPAGYADLLRRLQETDILGMKDHDGSSVDCHGWFLRVRFPDGSSNSFEVFGGREDRHASVFDLIIGFAEKHGVEKRTVGLWPELDTDGDPADLRARLRSSNPDLKRLAMSRRASWYRDIHRFRDVEPLFDHSDRSVRKAARSYIQRHLGYFGREAVALCLRLVRGEPDSIIWWDTGNFDGMVEYLGRHRVREATDILAERLMNTGEGPEPKYASATIPAALARIGHKRAVPALIAATRGGNPCIAARCATALADLDAREALPILEDLSSSDRRYVAQKATAAAARLGSLVGVPRLIEWLGKPTGEEAGKLSDRGRKPAAERKAGSGLQYEDKMTIADLAVATGHFAGLTVDDWRDWWSVNRSKSRSALIQDAVASCREKRGLELVLSVWALCMTESAIPLEVFLEMNSHKDVRIRSYAQYGLGHIKDERAIRALVASALKGEWTALRVLNAMNGSDLFDEREIHRAGVPSVRAWADRWEQHRGDFEPFKYHYIYRESTIRPPLEAFWEARRHGGRM